MSIVNEIAEKLGIDVKIVQDYYDKTMEDLKRAGIPTDQQTARADMITVAYFRAGKRSNAEIFEGLLLEVEPESNISAKRIEKAMRAYQENPDKAISEGFIKIVGGQPVAVDNIKFFGAGTPQQRENSNFGKPIDPNASFVNLSGYYTKKDITKKWLMKIDSETAQKVKMTPNVPVRFKAVMGQSINDTTVRLYPRGFEGFDVIQEAANGFNVAPLIGALYGHLSVPVEKVEEVARANAGKFGVKIMVKGMIDEINLNPSQGKPNLTMSPQVLNVTDMTRLRLSLSNFWRDHIDFGLYSVVYVIGSPWVFQPEGKEKLVGITVHNIIPIEKVELPKIAPLTSANIPQVPKTDEKFDEFNDSEFGKVKPQ